MAHNSVRPIEATEQPPVPERMEFESPWTVAEPNGVEVEVQLWADRGRGDAEVRILGGVILGTVAEIDVDEATLDPALTAVERYGLEWVEAQLLYAQALLAKRWSRR
jgi:hypothetical protein